MRVVSFVRLPLVRIALNSFRRDFCAWSKQMNSRRSISRITQQATAVVVGKRAAALAIVLFALLSNTLNGAEQPRIDLIEWYPRYPDTVSIHFGTAPNRTYTLQYIDRIGTNAVLTSSSTWGTWFDLYTAERLPFTNHYVIVDTSTNRHRFYRLRVTP